MDVLENYHWYDNGLSVISGDLLELYQAIDQLFIRWATTEFNAKDHLFSTFIQAQELEKINYFDSFPHLVTFPICLCPEEDNLRRFIEGKPLSLAGEINLTATTSIREILTPAACYHIYVYLQNKNFDSPVYITTVNNCFRRESHYKPLQRQWNFHMREIVCLGNQNVVEQFLENAREKLKNFFKAIGLPIEWDIATDPFFQPESNPKYIAQIVVPTKIEMIFQDLSIGSTNLHRDYFGKNFSISMNGETIHSACVAFGLERWVYAFIQHFGEQKENWPNLHSLII